jgi:hypothetical protein
MRRETREENWRMMGFSGPNSGQIGQEEEAKFSLKKKTGLEKLRRKTLEEFWKKSSEDPQFWRTRRQSFSLKKKIGQIRFFDTEKPKKIIGN